MADTTLPNLNAGHLDACVTQAVYTDPDARPVLVVVECAEGCPHKTIELPKGAT